mgnify:FL=1
MVTINGVASVIGTIICAGTLFTAVVLVAILGTRVKLGVYLKWGKAKSNKLRILILSQVVLLLSLFVWIGTGILDTSKIFSLFRLVILALIFILMFILGFTINRKIVKTE